MLESSDPRQVLSRLTVTVKRLSLQLTAATGTLATMSGSLLHSTVATYPSMLAAEVSVGAAALTTPIEDIVRTGALSPAESHFLHVGYTSQPEGRPGVDHAVAVRMAPAYVTVDVPVLQRLAAFFALDGAAAVDLSALGAQAATRIQEMQVRAFAATVALLLSCKPLLHRVPSVAETMRLLGRPGAFAFVSTGC